MSSGSFRRAFSVVGTGNCAVSACSMEAQPVPLTSPAGLTRFVCHLFGNAQLVPLTGGHTLVFPWKATHANQ